MTNAVKYNLHPFCRLAFLIGSSVCILLMNEVIFLLPFYIVYILPVVLIVGNLHLHIRLLAFGILPIFLTFILLYILILNESNGDWNFVVLKCLKILSFTSVFQITLSIPPKQLIGTFKKWGFKGEGLLTLIGAFTVWAEVKTKSYQILTARFARGFIGTRNILNTTKQLPFVLIPLIIGVIRTSTERVDVWEQREIPLLLEHLKQGGIEYSIWINTLVVILPWSVALTFTYLQLF